jgi:hypothetical protein
MYPYLREELEKTRMRNQSADGQDGKEQKTKQNKTKGNEENEKKEFRRHKTAEKRTTQRGGRRAQVRTNAQRPPYHIISTNPLPQIRR